MLKSILKENIGYLTAFIVLLIISLVVKLYFSEYVLSIDDSVSDFFQIKLVNEGNTTFMKIVTFFGSAIPFIVIVLLTFLLIKNKSYSFYMFVNLLWVYVVSVIFKNVIMRERPVISLIEKPSDFSFPSGHTMCSIAFYGFVVYLLLKNVKNYFLKWLIIFIFAMLVIFIGISRIYLNVHYFTDVIAGLILGLICLLMIINIYIKNEKQ